LDINVNSIRYEFEQFYLPWFLFENGNYKALAERYLANGDEAALRDMVIIAWESLVNHYIAESARDTKFEGSFDTMQEIDDFLIDVARDFGIDSASFMNFSLFRNDGVTMFLIQLPEPPGLLFCSYIALAADSRSGLMYLTLERSLGNTFMFCGIFDYFRGSYYTMPNNRNQFLDDVSEIVRFGLRPYSSLQQRHSPLTVTIDGQTVQFREQTTPYRDGNEIMVPLTQLIIELGGGFFEHGIGVTVMLRDEKAMLAIFWSRLYTTTEFVQIGGSYTFLPPVEFELDFATVLRNGEVFFPLSRLADVFNLNVSVTGNTIAFVTGGNQSGGGII
jgi:hypothetical protein